MLTKERPFKEFIDLCAKSGACSGPGEAMPVMQTADTGVGMKESGTCADGLKLYRDGDFPESWALWVLIKIGKELDEECRKFFIDKIADPMTAMQSLAECDFLTEDEHALLTSKYKGKLPTAEKEITDGKVKIHKPFKAVK